MRALSDGARGRVGKLLESSSARLSIGGVLVLLSLPFLLGDFWSYQLALYYLYAIAALGVGLCWGRTGFLPLGQALYFGLGAYLSGWALLSNSENPWWLLLWLPLAVLVPGVVALVIGLLVFRRRGESGPYFSMITLALSLLAYQLANNWESVTGGFNGLKGIPGLPGLDGYTESYYVAAIALIAAVAVLAWLRQAPVGVLWSALANNERRAMLFGFDTNGLKASAYAVSGLIAGLGGVLYAPQQGLVTPQLCGFVLSADLVIWTAVGGRAALLGPAIGALLIGSLTSELRMRFEWWEMLIALIFIAVVLLFPQGIAGLFAPLRRRFARNQQPVVEETAPPRPLRRALGGLIIQNVRSAVGNVVILDQLSLTFDRPGIFCVIGPNGAGKTSTFNMITGELPAQSGQALFNGERLSRLLPHQVIRLGIGRKFQIPSVFAELSIADNLAIALWSGRVSRIDLLKPRLRHWTSAVLQSLRERYPFLLDDQRQAAQLSHGERQLLELSMALLSEPQLLLLDEPCAGLSPAETAAVTAVIRWASERQRATIVVIEHDMALVKELAETVYVLHNGALLAQGTVAQVQADPAVRAVYVGAQK